MEYKVIPFVASIDSKNGISNIEAQQLQSFLTIQNNTGGRYVRPKSVTTFVQPKSSCFRRGAKPSFTTTRQMIVFQK